jgi:hypothetical protein
MLQSSTQTISTRAAGSLDVHPSAVRSPLIAPWQPMKPTCTRWVSGDNANDRISPTSIPGDWNPVQVTTTRCVTCCGWTSASSIACFAARIAKGKPSR